MNSIDRPHYMILTTIAVFVVAIGLAVAYPFLKAKSLRADDILTLMGAVQSLKQCISEPSSWSATIQNPKNAAALRCVFSKDADKTGCADGKPVEIQKLLSYVSRGAERFCLPGYDLTDPEQGLSPDGHPCKGFSARGNDECPYRIEINWIPHCVPGKATCINPQEEIVFALNYHPGPKLAKTGTPIFSDGLKRPQFEGKQTTGIWRDEIASGSSLIIAEAFPAGFPGGPCKEKATQPTRRMMNLVQADSQGRATTDKDGTFWLKGGEYDCRLSVPGFKVGTFRAVLMTVDDKRELLSTANGYSSSVLSGSQARTFGSSRFGLVKPNNHLQVVQICTEEPHGSDAQKYLALGVPMGVGPEVYAVLECQVVPEDDL